MNTRIKEGELYKLVTVFGRTFELRYGYYEDYERESRYNEPIPIYPDFVKNPEYTADGYPFVTEMQPACRHYDSESDEDICFRCRHFIKGVELFGICKCRERVKGIE